MAREILNAKLLDSLLKQAIVDAATKKTRVRISDGDNLNLIVRANGAASWVLDYRFAGKRKPLIGTNRDLIEVRPVLLERLRLLCGVATVGARGLSGRFQAPDRVAAAGYEQPLVGA